MVACPGTRGLTENEARCEVERLVGSAIGRVEQVVALVLAENDRQNLISRSSATHIWSRHILDSVQLASFARPSDAQWADIGTGAGFPGLVIAAVDRWEVVMVEPRRLRAEFLSACVGALGLTRASVAQATAQRLKGASFDIVSARAVASLSSIFAITSNIAKPMTRYIVPKGQQAHAEIESARSDWHGVFHVEQSLTNPLSGVIVAEKVRAR